MKEEDRKEFFDILSDRIIEELIENFGVDYSDMADISQIMFSKCISKLGKKNA